MRYAAALLLCLTSVSWAVDDPVVGFRGDGDGVYPDATPPLHWSKDKNVVWSTPIPESNSVPVLVDDRIFVTAEPTKLICLRASDGKKLWERDHKYRDLHTAESWAKVEAEMKQADAIRAQEQELRREMNNLRRLQKKRETPARQVQIDALEKRIANLEEKRKTTLPLAHQWEMPRSHRRLNGYSTPTPISDGRHVWALFGHGIAVCYDIDGTRKWMKMVQRPTNNFGHSASPVLVGDTLITHIIDMIALDAKTGQERWRSKLSRSWGSPLGLKLGGTPVVMTPQCQFVRVADGKVLGGSRRVHPRFCTPVIDKGVAYFVDSISSAVELPSEAKEKMSLKPEWRQRLTTNRYFASPVVHDGLLYTIDWKGNLAVAESESGKVVYNKEPFLKGRVFSNFALAGKYLFISNDEGATVIVEPGKNYKEVARNQLGPIRSTPVFDGNRMYLRTLDRLYCIAE